MVTSQLRYHLAAYKTLPLNGFEKVAIINTALIPHWTGWPSGTTYCYSSSAGRSLRDQIFFVKDRT